MSGFGFEAPGSEPVDPRQIGFGLMKRAQQGQDGPQAPPAPLATQVGARLGGGPKDPAQEADRLRVSPLETSVTPDAPIPVVGAIDRATNIALDLAAQGVANRVQARMGNLNRAPTTAASITQLGELGMSNEELSILRGAGVL